MIKQSTDELRETSRRMRIEILKMLNRAASGHTGGSLSATDILAALYFRVMNHDSRNPSWPERDRFVVENLDVIQNLDVLANYETLEAMDKLASAGGAI